MRMMAVLLGTLWWLTSVVGKPTVTTVRPLRGLSGNWTSYPFYKYSGHTESSVTVAEFSQNNILAHGDVDIETHGDTDKWCLYHHWELTNQNYIAYLALKYQIGLWYLFGWTRYPNVEAYHADVRKAFSRCKPIEGPGSYALFPDLSPTTESTSTLRYSDFSVTNDN